MGSSSILSITTSQRTIFFWEKGATAYFSGYTPLTRCSQHMSICIRTVHAVWLHTHSAFWATLISVPANLSWKKHWVADQSAWAWLAVLCRSKWAVFPLRLDIIGSGGACAEGLAYAKVGWETSVQHRFRNEHPLHCSLRLLPCCKHRLIQYLKLLCSKQK